MHVTQAPKRKIVGRIVRDTKGPPGILMEGAGLWNGRTAID